MKLFFLLFLLQIIYFGSGNVILPFFTSDDGVPNQSFGTSVSNYENTVVVGANSNYGGVYFFSNIAGTWTQQQKIPFTEYPSIGSAISIFGNYTVVGAPPIAYTFFNNGSSWIYQQTLIDGTYPTYGSSVGIYQNYMVVGEGSSINNQAFVHLYENNGTQWIHQVRFPGALNSLGKIDQIGHSVAIYKNLAVAGAITAQFPGTNTNPGSIYVLYNNGTQWIQQAQLFANDGADGDELGSSVSIYENYVIGGSISCSVTYSQQGCAYIFYFDGNTWIQQQKLVANDAAIQGYFGQSIFIFDGYVLVGAKGTGTAYFFVYSAGLWNQQVEYIANQGTMYPAVSMNDNYLFIGNPNNVVGSNSSQGAVYTQILAPRVTTLSQSTLEYTTDIIQTTNLILPTTSFKSINSTTNQIKSASNNSTLIGIVVGVIGGVLILIIIILISLFLVRRKKGLKPKKGIPNSISLDEKKGIEFELGEMIGKGNFGEVYKGKLNRLNVACKKIQDGFSTNEEEVKILSALRHSNIVEFIGIKTVERTSYIVMEYMNSGNLLIYIRNHQTTPEVKLFDYAKQICSGMEYLESKGIIHRDLALRNILCSIEEDKLICKISDFGLSKIIPNSNDYYKQRTEKEIAIKWCAPEVLFKEYISIKADVFSFGVVLFELFSKGETPWPGMNNFQVMTSLRDGERMILPKNFGPQSVIDVMDQCWKENHRQRPSFKDLHSMLKKEISKQKQDDYIQAEYIINPNAVSANEEPNEKPNESNYDLSSI